MIHRIEKIGLLMALNMLLVMGLARAGDAPLPIGLTVKGKPGAPVSIRVDGDKVYQSGQSIDLVVLLTLRSNVDKIVVSLRTSENLILVGSAEHVLHQPGKSKIIKVPVQLVAASDGLHRLRIVVRTEQNGRIRARVLSVAIQVGTVAQAKKPGSLITTLDGETLHELRVLEDVDPDL